MSGSPAATSALGIENTWAPLRRVLLHRPVETLSADDAAAWGYPEGRDLARCQAEFAAFAALLRAEGVEVAIDETPVGPDAVYACDPLLPSPFGPIVGRMRKPLRQPENAAAAAHLDRLGISAFAPLPDGHVEGGDVIWLDRRTVLVAVGHRSDRRGAEAFATLLTPHGVRVRQVEMPWMDGPEVCLHLRSLINVVGPDLAVVERRWLPTVLLEELAARGLRLIDGVEAEYPTQGNNLQAVGPRRVLLTAGNPRTAARLREAGVVVLEFEGQELCVKGTGGPTCLCFDLTRG
ncbi:MAG: arginine deiminase [Deltaproteobacteria bacterium]|nr:arginine deiminase [Deltaproteobacteria bacterium]